MNRLLNANPMPILLVLLAMMPAAMGMARGIVRCEHADATAHLAAANHHEQPDADDHCCCGSSDHVTDDATDDASVQTPVPSDCPDSPCDDTPVQLEPAPVQQDSIALDLPEAPLLPVTAWVSHASGIASASSDLAVFNGQPPGNEPGLVVVNTTIFRL